MSIEPSRVAQAIVNAGRSLFDRGLSHGTSGNISARIPGGFLMTPTGASLAELDPGQLSFLDANGEFLHGPRPTKEAPLHLALYRERPKAGAVVHLHASYSTAVSCLEGIDHANALPPLTAYYVMRVGTLPLVGFFPPGDPGMAAAVGETAKDAHAMLLANHGPVVAGRDLADAMATIEELEATAKLHFILDGHKTRPLDADQVAALEKRFGKAGSDI